MATVIVTWATQNENIAAASVPAHFSVTLGTVEAAEPLTATSHSFLNVDPGTYQGAVQCVDAAGAAMNDPAGKPYAPALFTVVVPVVPTAPIVVNVTSTQTP
jgi:hypothetical protein